MENDFKLFEIEVKKLHLEIENTYEILKKKNNFKYSFLKDGIVSPKNYFLSKKKILWILKEPYDKEHHEKGFSLVDDLKKYRALGKKEGKDRSNNTWHRIAYTTYGILNDLNEIKQNDTILNNPNINLSLLEIAFINIQKFPALTKDFKAATTTNNNDIIKAFGTEEINETIKSQIKTYNPNIIIEATNLRLITSDLDFVKEFEKTQQGHFYSNDKIIINTNHPGVRKSNKDYINPILNRIKEYQLLQK